MKMLQSYFKLDGVPYKQLSEADKLTLDKKAAHILDSDVRDKLLRWLESHPGCDISFYNSSGFGITYNIPEDLMRLVSSFLI